MPVAAVVVAPVDVALIHRADGTFVHYLVNSVVVAIGNYRSAFVVAGLCAFGGLLLVGPVARRAARDQAAAGA